MKYLQLRFMLMMCDFMLDWYYLRHMPAEPKQRKMDRVNTVRESVVKVMEREQLKEGL